MMSFIFTRFHYRVRFHMQMMKPMLDMIMGSTMAMTSKWFENYKSNDMHPKQKIKVIQGHFELDNFNHKHMSQEGYMTCAAEKVS